MKKSAFTMIELIFVIVILGILSAIAIPKLAATRDDATIVKELSNASQALKNLGSEYTAKGKFVSYDVNQSNDEVNCFSFVNNGDGNITLSTLTNANSDCSAYILSKVIEVSKSNGLINKNGSSKTYLFGGSSVVW